MAIKNVMQWRLNYQMGRGRSFFLKRQKWLALAASIYIALLILFHWKLPAIHVWIIAAFFSIAMNFTYLTEAWALQKHIKSESVVAGSLIMLSLLGLVISPLLLIIAIFGHGCWDLSKHFGRGLPFFRWYTCGCFIVDSIYSSLLAIYWLRFT